MQVDLSRWHEVWNACTQFAEWTQWSATNLSPSWITYLRIGHRDIIHSLEVTFKSFIQVQQDPRLFVHQRAWSHWQSWVKLVAASTNLCCHFWASWTFCMSTSSGTAQLKSRYDTILNRDTGDRVWGASDSEWILSVHLTTLVSDWFAIWSLASVVQLS